MRGNWSLVGDGNFFFNPINYSYNIRFYFGTKEEDFAKHISKLIKMLFGDGCKINIWRYPRKDEIILKMQRKAIYDKIKEYIGWQNKKALTVKVRGRIKNYSDNFIRGVIRGLIASDGDVDIKYKRVTLSTPSKNLAKQYSEMISRFGIVGHIYKLDRKDITRHPNTEYKITVRNEKYNKNLIKFKKIYRFN